MSENAKCHTKNQKSNTRETREKFFFLIIFSTLFLALIKNKHKFLFAFFE
jgi:hypothetical protein